MFKLIFISTAMLWSLGVFAQGIVMSGKVLSSKEKKSLPGATVEVEELKRITVADDFGNFRVPRLQPGEYTVHVRYVGYVEQTERVVLSEGSVEVNFSLEESLQMTDEVVVYATRANDKTPTTFIDVSKQTIQKQNFGQDLPLLLNWTPSLVATSDAGAGIGYTGLRIRGSDASRINVTINGIALNDSESQGVYWVNTPDLASSVQSIQVQRGVGTSTNGPGAFGATVSVMTGALEQDPYAELIISAGSFNSQRYTAKLGTGMLNKHWSFDGRVSSIKSDGYIDRAESDLSSYYFSGAYYGKNTIIKAISFGGTEQTYQAWYGTDQATMDLNRKFNYAGAIYDADGNVTRYYDNEVDHYQQDHYQLHISQKLSETWNANISGHYTYGRGYYEQYKQDKGFAELGLPAVMIGDSTLESSDVIVRRWLDNRYYGTTFSVNHSKEKLDLTIGGAFSRYGNARHFGEIVWSAIAVNAPIRYPYYQGESEKEDFNIYSKLNYAISEKLQAYVDVQYRSIHYSTAGKDSDQSIYDVRDEFNFLNPKAGLSYTLSENSQIYSSYGIANREPNRTDYLEGSEVPKSERLGNLELGWRRHAQTFALETNYYLMNYTDQLVLTGAVSDTGYPIRANVGKSYRTGIELSGMIRFSDRLNWNANVTWSINKNKDFTVFDDDNNPAFRNTSIILSPSWIGGSQLNWVPFENFQASLLNKYVGEQYLDNTENDAVKLADYLITDVRFSYQFHTVGLKKIELGLFVNNLFNVAYSSNGYGYGGTPYFFPQAGTNFMAMLSVRI